MSILIAGYALLETLYEDENTLVARALQLPEQVPVIIKTLKMEYPTLEALTRLRHEYEILQSLKIDGISQPIALESYANGLALVLSDFKGTSLKEAIADCALDLPTALQVAIQLATILAALHQHHVIHKDLKLQNILFNSETKQVRLIDFSISSRLAQESQLASNPNSLEGTLAYLSPEQTGRMNRAIDYRTDFYSLGVTLYEILTGQLPFPTTDPLELIHCHIAKTPLSPKALNPALPSVVSDIVMKLLAKTAEDRYQSALGLKVDLETCLQMVQTGQISHFQIGKLDSFSQFSIPQKLYGREQEVDCLMNAFDRISSGTTELVLVSGYSGVGKSSLVQEIHKPITRQRGYFISGKFDQFKRNIPYASLVQAFKELIRQILTESDDKIAVWQAKLLNALGNNAQLIIDVIPEVEQIIGSQPAVPALGAVELQNRFIRTFQQFVCVFSQPEHPLVLFLDDLQWADTASLKLIERLVTLDSQYLLVIGAYRDNEVSAAHPLMLTLEVIQETNAVVNPIILQPLDVGHVGQLVSDTLHSDTSRVEPLAELLFQKTQGNPFFLTQLLKSLYQEHLLTFNFSRSSWQWDVNHLQDIHITENVIELMVDQLQKLAPVTQQVLKLAACIGDKFTLDLLAIVNEQPRSTTAAQLWEALQVGLVLPLDQSYKILLVEEAAWLSAAQAKAIPYRFLHDRVQQAAYSLIPDLQKQETHLRIGQLLLKNTSVEERREQIFALVNHLNYGADLLTSAAERYELAELNLIAGQKAKASTAYEPANRYLKVGLELLAADSWQHQYELTLALYELAVETAYLNGDFEQMEKWATVVLQQAKQPIDKMKVYEVKIQACMAQVKQLEACRIGLEALAQLGIRLPEQPSSTDIQQTLNKTAANLAGKEIENLINLPLMTEVDKLAAIRMLTSMGSPTYQAAPALFPLVICEQVNLSIQYGNAPFSAYGYVCYGVILSGIVEDIASAYQFGELALKLVEQFNALELKTSVLFVAGSCTTYGKVHIRETLPLLLESYQSGLENGHFEYGGYGATQRCQHSYFMGQDLKKLESEMAMISDALAQLKQENALSWNQIFQQSVLNLLEGCETPCRLLGSVYNEDEKSSLLKTANDRTALHYFYLNKLILCYLFREYQQAIDNAAQAEQYLDGVKAFLVVPLFYFYDSLAQLAIYPTTSGAAQESLLSRVTNNQAKMQNWANHAPMNFQHKYELVEAEKARVLGQYWQAMSGYDRAIATAKTHGFIQEEALACELAAKFFFEQGKDKIAQDYLNQSYFAYVQWGAVAKIKDLEACYPQILAHPVRTEGQQTHNRTGESSGLDFTTVIKAAQALSSEIVLDKLLSKLMQMVLENAGAETGYLMLDHAGQLLIEASGDSDRPNIAQPDIAQPLGVANVAELPLSVINYVARTHEKLVLSDAASDPVFASDPYIAAQQPKSVLCIPILHQGKLIGVLYLENNLIAGAFTPDRLEVLQLLSSQAAISIQNARLYQDLEAANRNLETKVAERTLELQVKNSDLQQEIRERQRAETAAQSANRAKSEFLANMSHELRTPLNGILGYAQILRKATTLTEQQRNGVEIIYESGEHLLTLINDILDLSKIEARKMELHPTDFHLPSFLENLFNIFKVCARPKVAFLYNPIEPLPICVHADEKRLRQVLLNLLGNATKFTDQGQVTFRVHTVDSRPGFSTLRFEIEDTGIGISEEQLEEIFLPFHQVRAEHQKPEGTGLGLAISRQLVQMMGSEIQIQSTLGQGSLFWFDLTLPEVSNQASIASLLQAAIVGYRGDRRKILIVDNKRENRAVLVDLLKPLGFEVIEAIDGQDGLNKAHELRPDLILMDLVMPVIDGFEAIRRLRASPDLKDSIIIAVSASVFDFNQQTSQQAGCNDFLPKPIREEGLLHHLQNYLNLEWVYEQIEDGWQQVESRIMPIAPPGISGIASFPPPPSRLQLDQLFNLALQGDLGGIMEHVTQLEQADEGWTPFTSRLRQLAKAFEEQQILELIRQYREQL